MTDAPRITCQRELHAALRARADALGMSRETIDHLAGFQSGYSSKLLAAPPLKGMSVDTVLALVGTMGLAVELVEDARAAERISKHLHSRNENAVHASRRASERKRLRRIMRNLGKLGNSARQSKLSPEHRSRSAKIAARARWKKWRMRKREKSKLQQKEAGNGYEGSKERPRRSALETPRQERGGSHG